MSKKTVEISVHRPLKERRSLFQRTHSVHIPVQEIPSDDFKDNIEVVDSDGNITTKPRDFSNPEDYRDFTVEALAKTNPSMLAPSAFCTMSGGTPLDNADKVVSYMDKVGNKSLEMESLASIESLEQQSINSEQSTNSEQ